MPVPLTTRKKIRQLSAEAFCVMYRVSRTVFHIMDVEYPPLMQIVNLREKCSLNAASLEGKVTGVALRGIKGPTHADRTYKVKVVLAIVARFVGCVVLVWPVVFHARIPLPTRLVCLPSFANRCLACFAECYLVAAVLDVFTSLRRAQCAAAATGSSRRKHSAPASEGSLGS
jgi:hypothetical protein